MSQLLLVDTGPLVAFFSRDDVHHDWVTRAWRLKAQLVTCEAVLAETAFLLRRRPGGFDLVLQLIEEGGLRVQSLVTETAALRALIRRYASVPMSYADACLVRLSELHPRAVVTTCDSDFRVYRRGARQVIPLLAPF